MSDSKHWIQARADGVILKLVIQPKASRSEIIGLYGAPPRLKIRIAAPPVDGEANEEVLRFIKKSLHVTGARYTLERGAQSKNKDVLCEGVTPEQLEALLCQA